MMSLIESYQISPAACEGSAGTSFPLSYFDLPWLLFHPIRRLLFYDLPCSKSNFLQTHLPKLTNSLSLALKHYAPLAGQLFCPLNSSASDDQKPELRYAVGDSLTLSIFESLGDFESLSGYGPREADQFYDYVAQLPPVKIEAEHSVIPSAVAVQVTLFPDKGVCIGFTNHHSIGDASSVVSFLKTWASITKNDGSYLFAQETQTPCFERSFIKDPEGIQSKFWNQLKHIPLKSSTFPLPTNRVRATYVLSEVDIKKLKDFGTKNRPAGYFLSSFVVASVYVWTNLVKSAVVIGEELVDENVDELFVFPVNVRERLDPPVPSNYIGNCLSYGMAKIRHSDLIGEDGFVLAAEATAENIRSKVNNKDEVLKGAANWLSDMKKLGGARVLSVSGSPKFDLFDADFGWGRARKVEAVSIDGENYSMSLSKSRDHVGGLEIGLSLPRQRMEAFAALFDKGLK